MKRRIQSVLLCLWTALLAGCGSSTAAPTATPGADESLVIVRHVLQRSLTPDIVSLVVEVRDVNQALVDSPRTFPRQPELQLRVPRSAAILAIEYLGAGGAPLGSFRTTLDPTLEDVIVIEDPAWVSDESVDPTVYRFALTGCNRLGFGELSDDNPSSANRAQLVADLTQIPTASPPARFLFFSGDLVTNLEASTSTLQTQLTAWLALFATTPLAQSSVTLVPFTGNHEVLVSRKDPQTGEYVEFPNPPTLPVWVSLMGAFIKGSDGPTQAPPNLDQLTDDQSRLSYTFQDQDVLFVILNTDTFIDAVTLGDVPLNWLAGRLAVAQADPGVKHIFVMGHKPIESPPGATEPPGPGSIRTEEKAAMEQLLADHSKVRGYLCAHAHLWEQSHLGTGVPQVIAGNAGSPVEPPFNDTQRGYFGYTLVSLHASGQIHVEAWGRPIPVPYNAPGAQPPTSLRVKQLL